MKAITCSVEELLNNVSIMNSRHILFAAIAFSAMASGCNNGITNPTTTLNPGTLYVYLPDGTEVLAQSGTQYTSDGMNYIITATDNVSGDVLEGDEVTITVPIGSPLPYSVSAPPDATTEVGFYDADLQNPLQYRANYAVGNCTVTITQTAPTLQGTFQAIAVNTPDTVVLTNGSFNAVAQ
ncbi:MAG TPA: hypothetical protein VFD13_02705 [Candidatus Kapabacteria bacterium]|nr:hypothetical protein [Candidatus Kapabacteria bacterium]